MHRQSNKKTISRHRPQELNGPKRPNQGVKNQRQHPNRQSALTTHTRTTNHRPLPQPPTPRSISAINIQRVKPIKTTKRSVITQRPALKMKQSFHYSLAPFADTFIPPLNRPDSSLMIRPDFPPLTLSRQHYRVHPSANWHNPFESTPINERRNCWWRITRDGRELGYVEFHLFDEYANNATRHFRELCRGDVSTGDQAITLKGTYIHGIWPGNWIAGGDLLGTMGRSIQGGIVGGIFDIDILAILNYSNNRPGLISFSTDGNSFGSLWRIVYDAVPWTDGSNEVFGEIVKGWDIIKEIETTRTNARSQPLVPIMIADCGECPY